MPADAYASLHAFTSMSSRPRSQCSTKRVHPMPMIATRSLIPWLGISHWPAFPEVVHDAVGSTEATEAHLDPAADLHLGFVDVGELDRHAPSAVEVDDREHDGRARRVRETVDGERRDRASHVGERR